jgi:hypothetical protein
VGTTLPLVSLGPREEIFILYSYTFEQYFTIRKMGGSRRDPPCCFRPSSARTQGTLWAWPVSTGLARGITAAAQTGETHTARARPAGRLHSVACPGRCRVLQMSLLRPVLQQIPHRAFVPGLPMACRPPRAPSPGRRPGHRPSILSAAVRSRSNRAAACCPRRCPCERTHSKGRRPAPSSVHVLKACGLYGTFPCVVLRRWKTPCLPRNNARVSGGARR